MGPPPEFAAAGRDACLQALSATDGVTLMELDPAEPPALAPSPATAEIHSTAGRTVPGP